MVLDAFHQAGSKGLCDCKRAPRCSSLLRRGYLSQRSVVIKCCPESVLDRCPDQQPASFAGGGAGLCVCVNEPLAPVATKIPSRLRKALAITAGHLSKEGPQSHGLQTGPILSTVCCYVPDSPCANSPGPLSHHLLSVDLRTPSRG